MVQAVTCYPATITAIESDAGTTITVRGHQRDLGRIIGERGRTAEALRTIVRGEAEGRRYLLKIDD